MSGRAAVSPVTRVAGGTRAIDADLVAVEAPLALEATQDGRPAPLALGLLMRTPGDDRDLVTGWLVSEQAVRRAGDLKRIDFPPAPDGADVARAVLDDGVDLEDRLRPRAAAGTSACGLCGRLEMIAAERQSGAGRSLFEAAVFSSLPERLRAGQAVFAQTGGLHAAALCAPDGGLLCLREDVGRHNAVDKVVGAAWAGLHLPDPGLILAVSGRVAFEIVQKGAAAGVGAIVAVGAPSSLAVEAARAAGLVLAGFARDGRMNLYAGASRVR